jgi:hypothetical protein
MIDEDRRVSERITLDIPESVLAVARSLAVQRDMPLERVLVDLLGQVVDDTPVEMLSDDQVLALADSQMSDADQAVLSRLLAQNREGTLTDQTELDRLMSLYRRGMVRKAQALRVAVERGLRPSLIDTQSY